MTGEHTEAEGLSREREDAIRALGLDPSTVAWENVERENADPLPVVGLSDDEWIALEGTGLMPSEPRQAMAMTNRAFVDAVLQTAGQNRRWTTLSDSGNVTSEAVRKKFSRWAALGHWARLGAGIDAVGLTLAHSRQLKAAVRHAAGLRRNR